MWEKTPRSLYSETKEISRDVCGNVLPHKKIDTGKQKIEYRRAQNTIKNHQNAGTSKYKNAGKGEPPYNSEAPNFPSHIFFFDYLPFSSKHFYSKKKPQLTLEEKKKLLKCEDHKGKRGWVVLSETVFLKMPLTVELNSQTPRASSLVRLELSES